jgi:hypothetical protein
MDADAERDPTGQLTLAVTTNYTALAQGAVNASG